MRVKPLTGQVLIEILPEETKSPGGIELPQGPLSPEQVQERHANPVKPPPWTGVVREIGKWPVLPGGLTLLPEFGINSKVLVPRNAGTRLRLDGKKQLRLVRLTDVMAVLT